MYLICKMDPAYLVNNSNTISQNHTCTLDRKAPVFDFPNDLNSKILLQKMVAGYRQSCMAILMNYASQCDRVFCGDSKRKINIKYFLIPAYNNNLSQVCKSAGLQVCKSASLQVCSLRLSHTGSGMIKKIALKHASIVSLSLKSIQFKNVLPEHCEKLPMH